MLSGRISGVTGPYQSLADIGIDTGPVGTTPGTATRYRVDETKFTQALQNNPDAVFGLLSAAAGEVNGYLDSVLKTGGLLSIREGGFDDRLRSLDDYIRRLEDSLARREEFLRRQFVMMETLMAQLQVQSGQLGAQILQTTSGRAAGGSQ